MSALPRHFLEVVRLIVPGDRMERRIAVFTAFMDESNSHFGAKWFVLGGFLGRATDWLSFEGHWAEFLDRHGLSHLHTTDLIPPYSCTLAGRGVLLADRMARRT
jgi:hypothetical protein